MPPCAPAWPAATASRLHLPAPPAPGGRIPQGSSALSYTCRQGCPWRFALIPLPAQAWAHCLCVGHSWACINPDPQTCPCHDAVFLDSHLPADAARFLPSLSCCSSMARGHLLIPKIRQLSETCERQGCCAPMSGVGDCVSVKGGTETVPSSCPTAVPPKARMLSAGLLQQSSHLPPQPCPWFSCASTLNPSPIT